MRVLIITQDEPFFIPRVLNYILSNRNDEFYIAILKPYLRNKSFTQATKERYHSYSFREFLIISGKYLSKKINEKLYNAGISKKPISVENIAHSKSIPVLTPEKINSKESLNSISIISPDVIVSISAPQIFKKRLLNIPLKGVINLHGSMLPKYRGLQPSFWALYNGERETGSTVHYMSPGIDEGDIIIQGTIPIYREDSQWALIERNKINGAKILVEALDLIERDLVEPQANPLENGEYYSFPEIDDFRKFHAIGRRII